MTEKEKIAYAKSFIDKLAIGVDPTDGTLIPDGEIVLNPRISKCFLYVSDVLAKIIEESPKNENNIPFNQAPNISEIAAKIPCSGLSASISALTKRINIALGDLEKLRSSEIIQWLLHEGYLTVVITETGSVLRRSTEAGIAQGIITTEGRRKNGQIKYNIRYNTAAQKFIYQHLPEIIEFSKKNIFFSKAEFEINPARKFEITNKEILKYTFSEIPLTVSNIAEKINLLKENESEIRLKATDITNWLLSIKVLEVVVTDTGNYKLPSEIGIKLGISVEERNKNGKKYSIALYNKEAQKFIIDNINAIATVTA